MKPTPEDVRAYKEYHRCSYYEAKKAVTSKYLRDAVVGMSNSNCSMPLKQLLHDVIDYVDGKDLIQK